MAFSAGDFVNANVENIAYIAVLEAIINNVFDSLSNGIPVKSKQPRYHLPGNFPRPGG